MNHLDAACDTDTDLLDMGSIELDRFRAPGKPIDIEGKPELNPGRPLKLPGRESKIAARIPGAESSCA